MLFRVWIAKHKFIQAEGIIGYFCISQLAYLTLDRIMPILSTVEAAPTGRITN